MCRKLMVIQMFLARRNANEFCPVDMQLVIALWILTSFAFICKFISAFQIALICIIFECSFYLVVMPYWLSC